MKKLITLIIICLVPIINYGQALSYVVPNNLNAGQTIDLTIYGLGTQFDTANQNIVFFNFVQFSSAPVNSINVVDSVTMIVNITVPANTYTGYYDVFVVYNGTPLMGLNDVIYVAGVPVAVAITSLTPNYGAAGQTIDVLITGEFTNFSQATMQNIDFHSSQTGIVNWVYNISVINDTKLLMNITIPDSTSMGNYSVLVYNEIDGLMTLSNGFNVGMLAVTDKAIDVSMHAYPNPVNELLTIETAEPILIEIYSVQGNLIERKKIFGNTKFNFGNYVAGIYIVKAIDSNNYCTYNKVIKQ